MVRAASKLLLAVTALAVTSTVIAEEPQWRQVSGPPELSFPRDHGAHFEYRTEWWYVTGLVADAQQRRYGFQITFFRQGIEPGDPRPDESSLRARQIVAAHLAIADISAQQFHHAERLRRIAGGLAGASQTHLEVWLEDWRMVRADDGLITMTAHDPEQGIGLDLELRPQRGLVRHGDRGYSRKGDATGNASIYLSWTRLQVAGEIEVEGALRKVQGAAWFDHEWGTSQLGAGVVGWDWFSLRLDDGRDLMLYRLRRSDGGVDPRSSGTVVGADGVVSILVPKDVDIDVLKRWTSPATGARYPIRWRLRIPAHDVDLDVRALLADAELDGSVTTGVIYWEGPVEAAGTQNGEGYVEMTGYAGTLEGLF
ncbi:MAG: carotenoid 1,2-hydratase [Acidobacteria bacterium]|jgi:predicted secreted hydrolase|nr:carotenoid 1,2-hydratase [Acidobacteriota bacterium]